MGTEILAAPDDNRSRSTNLQPPTSSLQPPYNSEVTSADIKARAAELGFDLCGIAPAGTFKELAFLPEWLGRGYAGEMQHLQRSPAPRAGVRAVLPSARAGIALPPACNTHPPY